MSHIITIEFHCCKRTLRSEILNVDQVRSSRFEIECHDIECGEIHLDDRFKSLGCLSMKNSGSNSELTRLI